MEKKNNQSNNRPRRTPGGNPVKKKAPHVKPRKNQPVQEQIDRTAPEVVYLPPKPFKRSRFILHLATVVAIVVAIMLGLSIFFKVEKFEVVGAEQYTPWQIQEASGIKVGEQLLSFGVAKASGKITNALPYVKYVRIGVRLPDTVRIEIVETKVAYAIQDQDNTWWLMDALGKILEQCPEEKHKEHTVVTGLRLSSPAVGQQAVALEPEELPTDEAGNPIPVTVTAAQRLMAIKDLAKHLENNSIIGQVASIDVTDLYEMSLWYEDTFHVLLGDTTQLELKIRYLKGFVDDYSVNRPYESGELNLQDPDWIEYDSFYENGKE